MTVETTWNTTESISLVNTMDSSGFISILIIIGLCAVLVGVLGFALTSLERYRKIWAILTKMGTSVLYFAYGCCVIVPLVMAYIILTWLIEIAGDWHIDPIWIVYLIGGYVGISAIGWIVKRTVDRAKELHKEVK
jgi:hypothetical protein